MRSHRALIVLALTLIFGGGLLAWLVQTSGGDVEVRDVRWTTPTGRTMSALLYVPDGASEASPAPGILATHGYINSRETQSGFAIEFARRGYVVLAIDQTGHGYSDPPAFAEGFGGPAGLQYLRSLPFVDTANVGMEGHSMGGWASLSAAAAHPADYKSIVLAGSSTGGFGTPAGTPDFPRNFGLVWSRWDEFSETMWGTPTAAEVKGSERLKTVFSTAEEIEVGRLYGSIEQGTGRMLFEPRTNHPGDHLSRTAIGDAVEWFAMTLDGGRDLPSSDQTWYWKELGTTLGIIGMILLLLPVGSLLLATRFFAPLTTAPLSAVSEGGRAPAARGWWVAAIVTALLGPLTLFPFKDIPTALNWSPGALFPQGITNSVIAWTTALALISIVLLGVWHLANRNRGSGSAARYGLAWRGGGQPGRVAKAFLLAFLIVLAGYLTLVVSDLIFTTDFRFWVFAIKPMSMAQLRMAIVYFLPFALYFLVLNTTLIAQLARHDWSLRRSMLVNITILTIGWVGLYLYQYIPLLSGRPLPVDEPLWTIISYQLLPLMTIAGVLLSYFNRKTGTIYTGGFAVAMLVTWIVVASQATQFAG